MQEKVLKCPHCLGESIWKNGSFEGVQRFLCKDCSKAFTNKEPMYSQRFRDFAIQMYLNNAGIRKIAILLKISPTTVLNWVRKSHEYLQAKLKRLDMSDEPDIIEFDEIYTYVQKNAGERSCGLLILEDKCVLLRL